MVRDIERRFDGEVQVAFGQMMCVAAGDKSLRSIAPNGSRRFK
jgi:hypothetical protein